jgi:saccharopine dehydrogenase-like NADP-dependent oxidoreductase
MKSNLLICGLLFSLCSCLQLTKSSGDSSTKSDDQPLVTRGILNFHSQQQVDLSEILKDRDDVDTVIVELPGHEKITIGKNALESGVTQINISSKPDSMNYSYTLLSDNKVIEQGLIR